MGKVLSDKFTKYIDPNIFDILHDLENIKHDDCCPNIVKAMVLQELVTRLIDQNSNLSWEFVADCLDEIALIFRDIHQEKELAFADFERRKNEFNN